jgi:hypothetical protein
VELVGEHRDANCGDLDTLEAGERAVRVLEGDAAAASACGHRRWQAVLDVDREAPASSA